MLFSYEELIYFVDNRKLKICKPQVNASWLKTGKEGYSFCVRSVNKK